MFLSEQNWWYLQYHWIHLKNTPTPKAQETLWKRGQKDRKNQKTKEFTVRLCLLIMSQATSITPDWHDCPNVSWARMTPIDMPKWTGEERGASTLYNPIPGSRGMLGVGRVHQLVIYIPWKRGHQFEREERGLWEDLKKGKGREKY